MDQDTTNPVEELEVETPEEELDDELDTEETDEEEEETPPEDDSVEVEYEGQKYRVPPALKDSLLRQSDYTRKTQELAEVRKQLETTLGEVRQATEEERGIEAQFTTNAKAIEEYKTIDWQKWADVAPVEANKARMHYQDLLNEQQQLATAHQSAQAKRLAIQQQETAKRLAEGQKVIAERIPDWGQDKANAILSFGQEQYGLSADELREIDDPRAILILNDAMQFRAAQKATATKQKVEKQQAIKPAATIKGGGNPPKGLSDNLSADEWIKRRNAQVAKRNRG